MPQFSLRVCSSLGVRYLTSWWTEGSSPGGATDLSVSHPHHTNSQLDAAEEGSKKSHHAEKLHTAQVLHNELLTDVGDPVQRSSPQNQKIPKQLLLPWTDEGQQETKMRPHIPASWASHIHTVHMPDQGAHQGLAADQVGRQLPPCSRHPANRVLSQQNGQSCTSPRERTRTAAEPPGW